MGEETGSGRQVTLVGHGAALNYWRRRPAVSSVVMIRPWGLELLWRTVSSLADARFQRLEASWQAVMRQEPNASTHGRARCVPADDALQPLEATVSCVPAVDVLQ